MSRTPVVENTTWFRFMIDRCNGGFKEEENVEVIKRKLQLERVERRSVVERPFE